MASKKSQDIGSNIELSLSKNVVGRDSFEERICDDLCEEIFQWLPFDEKIKLIDVSQQFNKCLKTLWIRQKVLKIGSDVKNERNNCLMFVTQMTPKMTINSTKILRFSKRFSKLLQTFPNIISIVFKGCDKYINVSQILDSITENCNKLESFRSDSFHFDSKSILNFSQKFGPNIKTLDIRIGNIYDFKGLIKRSTSLKSLRIDGSVGVMFEFDDNSSLLVNNLKKLSANFKTLDDFNKIIENNKSLTHLDIRLDLILPFEISIAFKTISQLKELKCLRIILVTKDLKDTQIVKRFESIARNCINLKTFDLEVYHNKHFEMKDFFNGFKAFSSLNKLSFQSYNENFICNEYNLSIDCIKNCKQLTHLTLKSDNIPKEFFSDIDSVFPHLKQLIIKMRDELTDIEIKSMSRLKHLERLALSQSITASNELTSITDSGMLSLINGCNRLNSLSIYSTISLTEHSINSMIQKAIKNPGIYFKYFFYITVSDENIAYFKSTVKKCLNLNNIQIIIRYNL